MALDGMLLRHIVNEIKTVALGARVYQIYQPNKDEIILVFRTQEGNKRLLLSTRANSPRINFTEFPVENPATPPMLCMLLRKRLGGGKLIDVSQVGLDRIVRFDFECINELGDKVVLSLVVEIMGKYSNVILVDRDERIIDALKRVDLSMSSKRLVLPNVMYELPEKQDKLNIMLASPEEVVAKITDTPDEKPLNKAVLSSVEGISPIICREIEHKVSMGRFTANKTLTDTEKIMLYSIITNLSDTVLGYNGKPVMLYHKGDKKPFDIAFVNISQYGKLGECKVYESFSRLVDSFYAERDSVDRMRVKTAGLNRVLTNLIHRTANKINIQQRELSQCENREQLRITGDLLQANLYRVPKGAESVTVENFYDEANAPIEIKLNPAISPAKNAQKYYKDYNKAKNAEKILTEQLQKAQDDLVYLESLKESLARATNEKELSQIRLEFIEQGYIKQGKNQNKKPQQLPPIECKTSDGFKVLVGRNNKQNDYLTLKLAHNRDMWFHTKDIPGAHTIIITEGKEITETAISEGCQIAAYHSKGKESSNVPVDYTLIKNVSKPKGAKPGMVIFVNNKTMYVNPKLPEK